MTGIRWGFTFLMGVESGWRLQRSTVRCNPRQRYRRRKTSPALSRKRTNTAPGNGLFRQLAYSPPRRGGVAAPPKKCREATEAAQTGWSERPQSLRATTTTVRLYLRSRVSDGFG